MKIKAVLLVLASILLAGLSWADWLMFQRDSAHSGQTEAIGPQTNELKWSVELGAVVSPFGGPSIGTYAGTRQVIVGAEDGVYIVSQSGQITGHIAVGSVRTVVAVQDNRLFFGAGDTLYAYQAGEQLWAQRLGAVISHPTLYEDRVYVGNNKRVWVFDLDGNFVWMSDNLSGTMLYSAPAVDNSGRVYAVSSQQLWSDYILYAYSPSGSLLWSYPYLGFEGNGVRMSPTLDNQGNVYFATYWSSLWTAKLHSLRDNTLNWSQTSQALYSSPAYAGGVLYYGTQSRLEARSAGNGSLLWSYNTPAPIRHSSPAVDGAGNVYFGSEGGMFFSLDSQGAWRWSTSILGGPATSAAIDADGTVYVAAGNQLFAFGSQATGVEDSRWQIDLWVSPNPSSGQAQVRGYLPQSGRLSLAVYDLRGRLVLTLFDQDRSAGDFQAKLPDLPSGQYFLRSRINGQEQSTKVTIIR